MSTVLHQRIFNKINILTGGIEKFMNEKGYLKLKSDIGFKDIIVEKIKINEISIGQYLSFNEDNIPDPEIRVRIHLDRKEAEVLRYEDGLKLHEIYNKDGDTNNKIQAQLTTFLNQWLTVILKQDYK